MASHSSDHEGSRFVVGIDLGGTKLHAGLATLDGVIVAECEVPTSHGDAAHLLDQLERTVHQLCAEHGIEREQVMATGIGGAGVPSDETATFDAAPNLDGVEELRLADELRTRLGHPIILENDVNVAALGELAEGIGREHESFVFVSVGTGIGMGVVIDGRLVRGSAGRAGEIGYLPFGANPFDPQNHRRGPLEEVVAGHTIADRYETATAIAVGTRDVFERARANDPNALAAIDDVAMWLATALVAVDAIINPPVFVLGGGIGRQAEIHPPIRAWLARLGVPQLDVRVSALSERAPIVGAVQLAIAASRTELKGQRR